uniref:Glutamyl-tRNA synthetase (EC) n=1 Tax=Ganoderma boninense TaxID=34458 RepID=A0A5K1K6W2_9APHY|nr:Glutamyl-tRNA synthetase (EC [Ganoderma boninense]
MTDIYTLLTFPTTSRAFSTLPSQPQTIINSRDSSRSASPPRKIPRLDGVSDSRFASAPSSRVGTVDHVDRKGPTTLRVIGLSTTLTSNPAKNDDYLLVKRTISILLTRHEDKPLPATYDRIYRACRAAVDEAGKGEGLYDAMKIALEQCVNNLVEELNKDPRKSAEWLVPFTNVCEWYEKQVGLLQSLLAYLDTRYVVERAQLLETKQLAYTMFTNKVIQNTRVTEAIMCGIADWLDWERTKKVPHPLRSYLPKLVRHIRAYGLYIEKIETVYLNLTHSYYAKESNDLAEGNMLSAAEFLEHVKRRSAEERIRAEEVLIGSSVVSVHDTADNALLAGRLQWLADDALSTLIKGQNDSQIKSMYELFAKVGGLKVLSASFKVHIEKEVKTIVTDVANDEDMVQRLLTFKAFADKLVATCFVNTVSPPPGASVSQPQASSSAAPAAPVSSPPVHPNRDFSYGLIDAFQAGFKARRNKPAELIAKHMDKAMRRGQKGKRDEDFAAELDDVLALYRFTDDMDVFRTFYQRALAKRLLLGRSASDDFEKSVLKKLEEQYDPDFGNGDKMFKDLALSRDLMGRFYEEKRLDEASSLRKMTAMVLQRSSWPFAARKTDILLPGWMQDDLSTFTQYYKAKHQGRTLDWDHALGTAVLRARFKAGEKELSVSLYQAVILLLFNEGEEFTYADIKEQTNLDDAELQRTLQSLSLGKKRVLTKTPGGRDVAATDLFSYNGDFKDPRRVVHINSIQSKETAEETKRTQSSIEADRKHALDAAIVRVMKSKKELTYEQLKTATIEAVKNHFVPDVGMIKKRIEGLVEQEYLRRDEDDQSRFFYVA